MIIRRRILTTLAATAALGLLAGCSASVSRTVPASDVAKTATKALESTYGITVDAMDCGTESVKLVNGTTVDCTVTVSGTKDAAKATVNGVKGDTYRVDVSVPTASWLRSPAPTPSSAAESPSTASPTAPGQAPTIYGYDLAKTTAGALKSQYGSLPTVICRDDRVALSVGATYLCDVKVAATGAVGIATVTITAVEGGKYSIDVKVKDA